MTRFALTLSLLLTTIAQAWGNYSLSDLEALTRDKNYEEFFSHALDIRPSERREAWKEMLDKMSEGYARQILSKSEVSRGHFLTIEKIYSWPQSRSNDVFKLQRHDIGLKYLKECLKKSSPCTSDLTHFWEADPKDSEVAIKLAEMTLSLNEKTIPTWNFLAVALKGPLSEFYCKKDFVLEAIWGKLEIDYIRLGSQGNLLKKIDESLHPDCLISFNQWAHKKLLRPQKVSDRELSYQILDAQGKANSQLSDFFYTIYLLENPSQGDLFNYAWNRLNELSKSMDRRENVLNKIKELDPLPDEIFSSLDQVKKRAILNHFKNKFPEYLRHYTNICLQYYEGKTTFPLGNPTMKCQNLMETDLAPELVGKDNIDRFHKLRTL